MVRPVGVVRDFTYGRDADVATRLLDDDAQDDTVVDARRLGDGLDRRLDERDLGVRVVELHQALVLLPEIVPAGPRVGVREVGRGPAVVDVALAGAGRRAAAAVGASGQLEDLADLELLGVDARVGGLEGLEGDSMALGDGEEGVACLDCVAHFDLKMMEIWWLLNCKSVKIRVSWIELDDVMSARIFLYWKRQGHGFYTIWCSTRIVHKNWPDSKIQVNSVSCVTHDDSC